MEALADSSCPRIKRLKHDEDKGESDNVMNAVTSGTCGTGSSKGKGGIENDASKWTSDDVEKYLKISYCQPPIVYSYKGTHSPDDPPLSDPDYLTLLDSIHENDGTKPRWPNEDEVQSLQNMLDKYFRFNIATQDSQRLNELMVKNPTKLRDDDAEFLKEIMKTLNENLLGVLVEGQRHRPSTSSACLENAFFFLQILQAALVGFMEKGQPIYESTYVDLFQAFARLFKCNFISGYKRKMHILGEPVTSIPDLRFDGTVNGFCTTTTVMTEVKRCSKEYTGSVIKTRSAVCLDVQDTDTGGTMMDDHVKGQHAVELLLELDVQRKAGHCLKYAFFNEKGKQDCILGFIVQGTKLILTCLAVPESYEIPLEKQSKPPQPAKIYYTNAYDMLVWKDRRHLAFMMLRLAFLGGNIYKGVIIQSLRC